ncbi:FkbM family methyltransferase [Ketobacter sp.]
MSLNENTQALTDPADSREFVARVKLALRIKKPEQSAFTFLENRLAIPRYIIGRNEESVALRKLIEVDGVIDDYNTAPCDEFGTPIVRSSDLPVDAWVVNCSTSISPVDVNRRLSALNIQAAIGINQIIEAAGGVLRWPWFVRDQRQSVECNITQWAELFDSLADDESQRTLLDVVCYRLTADAGYMQNYEVRVNDQYFEPFMNYSREVFVDAGGFDGDTTEAFCQRYPDYRSVHLFEPSAANMQAAKLRLSAYRDIHFKQAALSDTDGLLNFNDSLGSASTVSDTSSGQVSACRLDDVLDGEASFIKMDLEGWEMKALAGASDLIQKNRSKLAIAVYHNANDFLEVSRYVLALNPGRQVYLRHYTQGWSETIMYFK